ncbi:LysM peptidoglycan-binding domain-containing protein [Promicromonospora sukumoe]|uniref:LysM peptidoglycan-binding domain-containing protein n=1 Tax=Promicromonospora sukumoe TaxID=88382 RepID=UPI00036B6447|nr:LysM domain-containing protein [Promicromonospora sukumoe]
MTTHARDHTPAAAGRTPRAPGTAGTTPGRASSTGPREAAGARRGLLGLLGLGLALVGAAVLLGVRTWQVGAGLGAAYFPVEDIVELAAVAVGTAVAGWTGAHALLALACVLADRHGRRWTAAERTVARHAPAVVRRLARAAAGAGLGLALTTPAAFALPQAGPQADEMRAEAGPAVVLDLGWQPTNARPTNGRQSDGPGRSSLVNRSAGTSTGPEAPVVVEAGDTLWSIAAEGLARADHGHPGAAEPSDVETAEAVVRWYAANRAVVGADPDLIRPGMVLHQP